MRSDNFPLALLAAALLGIVQLYVLLYCWNYIAIYSPIPRLLLSLGATGLPLRALLLVLDFAVSVALCLPAAFALCWLRPRRLFVYLTVAVVPGFLWQYALFFQNPSAFQEFGQFIPGVVSALLMLPVATALASRAFKSAHA